VVRLQSAVGCRNTPDVPAPGCTSGKLNSAGWWTRARRSKEGLGRAGSDLEDVLDEGDRELKKTPFWGFSAISQCPGARGPQLFAHVGWACDWTTALCRAKDFLARRRQYGHRQLGSLNDLLSPHLEKGRECGEPSSHSARAGNTCARSNARVASSADGDLPRRVPDAIE